MGVDFGFTFQFCHLLKGIIPGALPSQSSGWDSASPAGGARRVARPKKNSIIPGSCLNSPKSLLICIAGIIKPVVKCPVGPQMTPAPW